MAVKDIVSAAAEVAAVAIEAGAAGPVQAKTTIAPEEGVGGPAAPPEQPMTRRQKFRLVGWAVFNRVRFIAVLAAVGLFIGYWDTVMNYWDKWTQPRSVASRELEPGYEFFCPMDPQVVQTSYEPNGDIPKCSICGMPLSKRKKGEKAKLPAGITARVQLSPERIQLAGIKTVPVAYRPVARQTKTVGYVAFDESRLSRIVSRVDGYVEKLYVNETFTVVHQGDPLAEIYSPELYSTARELALASRDGSGADLVAAMRTKLALLGVSRQEIDGIAKSAQASPRLVIRSPQEGYVVAKKIVAGAAVAARMTLFEVADLSTVWIEGAVYEKDIPLLQVGQKIEATVEAAPGRVFAGKLALIYPELDAASRTNRIRIEVDNPRHELRPGMFASVRISTPLESIEPYKSMAAKRGRAVLTALGEKKGTVPISRNGPEAGTMLAWSSQKWGLSPFSAENASPQYEFLVVPERAVIDTGSKKIVYVERRPGIFEGVEVELGPRQDALYPVIKGLKAGDKVAAAGGFLIDAETRLNPAAASTYFARVVGLSKAMIEKIIEFSIRNRFVVILATLGVVIWGVYAVINTPVDAIPDLSENQVIVFTDWMGRSPKEIEDQITYPLSVNLQGLAGVKAVRTSSEFNFSMINIIFDDNIDFYFARQRVLERLTLASTFLPPGVVPYMAPDATALGQIFWYTVEGEGQDLGRLRAIQDWYIRYQLNSVPGVAQVASAGGFPIEYQIDVDPNKLRAYNVTLGELFAAVAGSNSAVGGKVIQKGNAEYIVRGVGWIESTRDIEKTVVKADPTKGTPIYVSNLGTVSLGSEFRRSALEKNGNEAVGAVVMMRYGENPLEVTKRIKAKIQELQPGLPKGVRIVPFYDRTRLIHGAIETVTSTLRDEMIIASLAILLILMHFRSAVLICMTLPLAVLVSFILMRHFNIASNIMSLSGIAISIGILVDQAIVMVENATHHLTAHFGHHHKITGDTREIVIPACKMVGRPIFFSVIIILLSFIPVFALTGQEGKTFHPLAFTKSFAMIGVAILSITLVPALIPTFIKGRLRSEEESWLVRNMIGIYKPWLTWLMPRWNLAMWAFSALLILGAGLFPMNAIVPIPWHWCFLVVTGVTMAITVIFTRGARWQVLSFVTLAALSLTAYKFPKIGVDYMPPLDEGSILDMPVTVPRASVTETTDDLKARDALLRRFPEIEMIVGKSGRADTPTDPSPLDMVESVITLRPKEYWPKRKLNYQDAEKQTAVVLAALQSRHLIDPIAEESQRHAMLDPATMNATVRFDATMRETVLRRFCDFQADLGPKLLREFVAELVGRWQKAGRLLAPPSREKGISPISRNGPEAGSDAKRWSSQKLDLSPFPEADIDRLATALQKQFAQILSAGPGQEDVNRLIQAIAERLAAQKKVDLNPELLTARFHPLYAAYLAVAKVLGSEPPTLFTQMFDFIERRRDIHWRAHVRQLGYDIFPRAVAAYDRYAIEELHKLADEKGLWAEKTDDAAEQKQLTTLRAEFDAAWSPRLFLWKKSKDDLLKELDSVVRMPGWANIWTQPIINRIDMLATGVRTMIGVKVFGNDLDKIQEVSEQVAEVLRHVPGAVDVFPDQSRGKGYLEIKIERDRAARYGVKVSDIQDVIETALGGKTITMTVEGRERFPVRVRYNRDSRQDEEDVKNLLVSAASAPMGSGESFVVPPSGGMNRLKPELRTAPVQIPLAMVADVKIVEGPAMIKSENGMLRNYVQLNVRDRDVVGFVEEAQRVVAQKVKLPQGMYLAWSGQFENQVRAGKTMLVVFPAVILVIFIILFLTYNDLIDALLMMKAVPEAMVGGIFLLWLFGYHFSVAVQVGFIACFGMATETGIIMLVYLRDAVEKRGGLENIRSLAELRDAVIEGAVHRLRPKLLTEGVAIIALAPMLWASGVGHEVISAMAAPVLGGLLIADEVVDIFIPVRFYWVRRSRWLKMHGIDEATAGYDRAVRPCGDCPNFRSTKMGLSPLDVPTVVTRAIESLPPSP